MMSFNPKSRIPKKPPCVARPRLPKSAANGYASILDEALHLYDQGLWVVPTSAKGAFWKEWQTKRRSRDELIASLKGTEHNIALVLNQSPFIDVECDTPEAEASLQAMFGRKIPATPTWQSVRGKHRLFQRASGLPEVAKMELDGIEFRIGNGKGACSVIPPSAGRAWLPALSIHEIKPAELPSEIVERLGSTIKPRKEPKRSADGAIFEPGRNDELFKQACNLFRNGHSVDHVRAMICGLNLDHCKPPLDESEVIRLVASAQSQVERGKEKSYPYSIQQGRTVFEYTTKDGPAHKTLCNFAAQIVEQITADNGVEQRITFALAGQLASGQKLPRVEVPASEFGGMAWVVPSWGTKAVVYAAMGTRDHLRAAMQLMSGDAAQRIVFEHTGWREVDDEWVYLHAGGAIGAAGTVQSVQVSMPEGLTFFRLPDPPTGEDLQEAIRASLRILDLAPESITASILGSVYRAVLASADFSEHLAGPTGAGKTELAALCQQHFGARMDARHLPGSWSSTANSLEALAFHTKDGLLVVDDFAPHGTMTDVARSHKEADRFLRAQGNRSGRGRCRPDGSLRPAKPPRGLILSTGEDIPKGQSLRARQWVLELAPGHLKWDRLTNAQNDAAAGKLAAAMAGFVRWLAPRIGEIRRKLPKMTADLREKLRSEGQHARTPGIAADLLLGWDTFLEFAVEVGVLGKVGRDIHHSKVQKALLSAAGRQTVHLESAEPASHFLRLLAAAITSGRAHVSDQHGNPPDSPGLWGWESDPREGFSRSRGNKIGWVVGINLYLEPDASYAAAQELARDQGEALAVGAQTLRKRLHERGFLASTESGKLTNRRKLEGQERIVLHLLTSTLYPGKPGESGAACRPPNPPIPPVLGGIKAPASRSHSGRPVDPVAVKLAEVFRKKYERARTMAPGEP